jgi:hypothetical protein
MIPNGHQQKPDPRLVGHPTDASRPPREALMLTRSFDDPRPVQFRPSPQSAWVLMFAFAIVRSENRHEVLIGVEPDATPDERVWVQRSRIRPAPPTAW